MRIKNKILIFSFVLRTLSFVLYSCSPTEPPNKGNINLQAEDVSCTEAWLKLETQNINLPVSVSLLQNSIVGQTFSLSKSDTIIYVDSLLPNKTYTFQISGIGDLVSGILSNKVTVTTMDTTSHNFSWQTWTFGGGGSSVFNDVAIVNDTLAFAVGEIYLNDSIGKPDPQPYNVAKWNGAKWSIQRVLFQLNNYNCSVAGSYYGSAKTVYAFDASNIVFTDGADFIKWNGTPFLHYPCVINKINGSVLKLWGISSNNFFAIGTNGTIIHYFNRSWQKLESGTSTIITDIWGIINKNNEVTAYCPVSSFFTPGDKKILKIKNNKVDSISWDIQRLLYSAWTNNEQFLYVCGSGAYENKKGFWEEIKLPQVSMNSIRGNDLNDIFIAGDFGFVAHFNGYTWKVYKDIFTADYYSISVKKNLIILAGQQNGKGVITIGREY